MTTNLRVNFNQEHQTWDVIRADDRGDHFLKTTIAAYPRMERANEEALREGAATGEAVHTAGCGACGGSVEGSDRNGVGHCADCGGLNTTRLIDLDLSFAYVSSEMLPEERAPLTSSTYYDLMTLKSDGTPRRRHGWYDPATKGITQVG